MEEKKHNETEKNKKRANKTRIEKTEAWRIAEFDYAGILVQGMIPLLSDPLTDAEKIKQLKKIFKDCPEFYPALFEAGCRSMQEGKDTAGKRFINKGLRSLKMHFPKKDLIAAYYDICDFLEKHLQFEMAIEYYNELEKIEKNEGKLYDYLSYCHVHLDDLNKAFEFQKKAIELCDSNNKFFCNMGWVELLRGNVDAAKIMLDKSLKLDPKDEVTKGNYEICKIMQKNKRLKNWEMFLLERKDYEYLEKLEEENITKYQRQIMVDNQNKLDAFKFDLLRKPEYTPTERYDIWFTLGYILNFIGEMCDESVFSYCDMATVEYHFKSIMHKFIVKTVDIDEELFNDAYTSLLEFYKFLAKRKVISQYKSLKDEMLKLKPELMEKMFRYSEIRHNDEYTKEEKAEIREELFEGDDWWPLL